MPGYWEFGYFSLALIQSAASDLLGAIVSYFNATTALTSAFTGGITTELNAQGTAYPFLEVTLDDDDEPGESTEDRPIDVTFTIRAGDADSAKRLAKLLRDNYDTPNVNANSTRAPLAWTEGTEIWNERESGTLRRRKGLGASSLPVWCYEQPYRFWCDTTPP